MAKVKCETCNITFKNEEGLALHNAAKHGIKKEKPGAEQGKKGYGKYILAIVGILIAFWLFKSVTGGGDYDQFTQCIADSGAKYYGAFWCPHCQAQKDLFGRSQKYLPYVECSTSDRSGQLPVCTREGIDSYPTWIFADGFRAGSMSLEQLSQRTGCSLVKDS